MSKFTTIHLNSENILELLGVRSPEEITGGVLASLLMRIPVVFSGKYSYNVVGISYDEQHQTLFFTPSKESFPEAQVNFNLQTQKNSTFLCCKEKNNGED